MSASTNESVVIKKYANRRLYNTSTSTYVTLENLAEMVKAGVEFNVYDAKTNEDITRSVLTQIIVEEEGKTGQNLLPISFMRRLISFYGGNMQWLVPKYLEHSMQSLTKNQVQIRDYFQTTFGSMFPFGNTLEQMSKQNLAMFERTMRMFSPFSAAGGTDENSTAPSEPSEPSPSTVSTPSAQGSSDKTLGDAAAEDVFTPSINKSTPKRFASVPTPETSKATTQQNPVGSEDVQNKIAALQRQLSELAKNKA